jgi:hypothetical protein
LNAQFVVAGIAAEQALADEGAGATGNEDEDRRGNHCDRSQRASGPARLRSLDGPGLFEHQFSNSQSGACLKLSRISFAARHAKTATPEPPIPFRHSCAGAPI